MTCIVGMAKDGKVFIGGDSAGSAGYDLTVRADTKVFRRGPFLLGFTSSFRMGQLLRYKLKVPRHPDKMADHRFMATLFIDSVRECLKEGGFAKKENEVEEGGTFLVGYRGRIYTVHDDYQVGEPSDGFAAVGCGEQIAHGALYVAGKMGLAPRESLMAALRASERFSGGVRGPFKVVAA